MTNQASNNSQSSSSNAILVRALGDHISHPNFKLISAHGPLKLSKGKTETKPPVSSASATDRSILHRAMTSVKINTTKVDSNPRGMILDSHLQTDSRLQSLNLPHWAAKKLPLTQLSSSHSNSTPPPAAKPGPTILKTEPAARAEDDVARQHLYQQIFGRPNIPARTRFKNLSKGLRHFSMKVCEKVQEKGVTTYNEVADDLVAEFAAGEAKELLEEAQATGDYDAAELFVDHKNIRRRVYDALNVLMAMKIITKEHKEIRWNGLPCSIQQTLRNLEYQRKSRITQLKEKQAQLEELCVKLVGYRFLIDINREAGHRLRSVDSSTGKETYNTNGQILPPFLAVRVQNRQDLDIAFSADKRCMTITSDNQLHLVGELDFLSGAGLDLGLASGNFRGDDYPLVQRFIPSKLEPIVRSVAQYGCVGNVDVLKDMLVSENHSLDILAYAAATLKSEPTDGHQSPSSTSTTKGNNSTAADDDKPIPKKRKLAYESVLPAAKRLAAARTASNEQAADSLDEDDDDEEEEDAMRENVYEEEDDETTGVFV